MSELYGVVQRADGRRHAAAKVGDVVLDLSGVLPELALPKLNDFLGLGRAAWQHAHDSLEQAPEIEDDWHAVLPIAPGDYVDFYSSIEHASNLGRMFRPDAEPLLPNWRHLPVGYHGRSSSVLVSGTPVRRPCGQRPPAADGEGPGFGPTQRLDIELELGFVTGPGNALGEPIPAEQAAEHIFGFVLVNDWSARDIQRWEYVPLGPFLGKSFATSIGAWITPLAAIPRVAGPPQEPEPLPYLRVDGDWALDIALEVELNGTVISRTNARTLYWNAAQQLAHATVNGCNVRPGDLYASGTISGSEPGSFGSLIELTWGGRDPLGLPDGSTRTFLEDGDTVVLRGEGLAECAGTILPAYGA